MCIPRTHSKQTRYEHLLLSEHPARSQQCFLMTPSFGHAKSSAWRMQKLEVNPNTWGALWLRVLISMTLTVGRNRWRWRWQGYDPRWYISFLRIHLLWRPRGAVTKITTPQSWHNVQRWRNKSFKCKKVVFIKVFRRVFLHVACRSVRNSTESQVLCKDPRETPRCEGETINDRENFWNSP